MALADKGFDTNFGATYTSRSMLRQWRLRSGSVWLATVAATTSRVAPLSAVVADESKPGGADAPASKAHTSSGETSEGESPAPRRLRRHRAAAG